MVTVGTQTGASVGKEKDGNYVTKLRGLWRLGSGDEWKEAWNTGGVSRRASRKVKGRNVNRIEWEER